MNFYTGHAHLPILSLTLLRVQLQLSGTHCLLLLGLLNSTGTFRPRLKTDLFSKAYVT